MIERLLATRFFLSHRREGAVSVASVTAIAGMAFGVGALLVSLSVISGFQREYTRAILGFNSHVVLLKADGIEEVEPVANLLLKKSLSLSPIVGWSPFLYREGMMIAGGKVKGIVLKGVDFKRYGELSGMAIRPVEGGEADPPSSGLYLGKDLAQEFLQEGKGSVRILLPPRKVLRLAVAGTFESGLYEYDSSFAFLSLEEAHRLFGTGGQVSGIELWLHDPGRADEWVAALEEQFRYPYLVMGWRDLNENIFRALELEKFVFFVLMMGLIGIASLSLFGTLVMLLLEKRREVAILRALGMPWKKLRRVFLWEGLMLGFLGTALGILMGLGLLFVIDRYQPIPLAPEVYFVKSIPVFYSWKNFFWVSSAALLVVFVGCEVTLQTLRRIPVLRTLVEG